MSFSIIGNIGPLPAPYPRVERKLPTAREKGWDKVGGFLLREGVDYMPQPGLQENVCSCEANIIYMCGAATGGKSFAGILMQLYRVDRKGSSGAMISTRLQDSKKGGSIFRDNELVLGAYGGCEYNTSDYPTFAWRRWGSVFRLIHSNFNTDNPAERAAFVEYAKKNQNGYQYFDEANDLPEFQYHYWNSRNRDASGCVPQSVYSFNPPGPDSYFTRNLVNGGYVDPQTWFFQPEMNGAVRYFYAAGDSVDDYIWGATPQEVCAVAGIVITDSDRAAGLTEADMVKSFAAFISDAAENRKLIAATRGGSVANLHATGKTQRSVLRGAYFGPVERTANNVSRQMMARLWENPTDGDTAMYATFDVGGGKGDSAPMLIWRGHRIVAAEYFEGEPQHLAAWIAARLGRYGVEARNFVYDATGFGFWLQGFTEGVAVTANRRPLQEYDAQGNPITREEYFNCRSQLLGMLEVALKRGDISCAVDPDTPVRFGKGDQRRRLADVLADGVDIFAVRTRYGKTYYNSKEEFKARYHYSPGEIDSMALRMVFDLDTRTRRQKPIVTADDTYDELYLDPPWAAAFSPPGFAAAAFSPPGLAAGNWPN